MLHKIPRPEAKRLQDNPHLLNHMKDPCKQKFGIEEEASSRNVFISLRIYLPSPSLSHQAKYNMSIMAFAIAHPFTAGSS